jgi:8-oxo-dGTP diphosphatase
VVAHFAPLTNTNGHQLIDFIRTDESCLHEAVEDGPVAISLVVGRRGDVCLIVFNKWRRAWELPGGAIEVGESPREAAIREFEEETDHRLRSVEFVGVAKYRMAPDGRTEYAALFSGDVVGAVDFVRNEEIDSIGWWNAEAPVYPFDELDRYLALQVLDKQAG